MNLLIKLYCFQKKKNNCSSIFFFTYFKMCLCLCPKTNYKQNLLLNKLILFKRLETIGIEYSCCILIGSYCWPTWHKRQKKKKMRKTKRKKITTALLKYVSISDVCIVTAISMNSVRHDQFAIFCIKYWYNGDRTKSLMIWHEWFALECNLTLFTVEWF